MGGTKSAKAKYYQDNKAVCNERSLAHKKATRLEYQAILNEVKSLPCMDCGVAYPPFVMDLDHVRGEKVEALSRMVTNVVGKERFLAEIAKCDVVCANCHRIRTFKRRES